MAKNNSLERVGYSVEIIDYSPPDTRHKRYYYRQCGMEVGPWPDDPKSQKYYLAKGFLLEPPKGEPERTKFTCQICGKSYDSLGGLIDCLKSHKGG